MALKKTCRWLDSNIEGGIQIISNYIMPCCGPSKPMLHKDDMDYAKVDLATLQKQRIQLEEDINNGTACQGCPFIVEKDEKEIDVGQIYYLSLAPFSTCNLRCKYCYFSHEDLGAKLNPDKTKILDTVKAWHKANLLKQNFSIGLAGGEPLLIEDIPETIHYVSQNFEHCNIVFLSNSTIKSRCQKLIQDLNNPPDNISFNLYTSIDAGTAETYEKIRGRDLFCQVSENVVNYAKSSIFNSINLKYILLFDKSNTDDKNIFGFLRLLHHVKLNNEKKTLFTIDFDMLNEHPMMTEDMLIAAGKLYYVATEILKIPITYSGASLVTNSVTGRKNIELMKKYAEDYSKSDKPLEERLALNYFQSIEDKFFVVPEMNLNLLKKVLQNKNVVLWGASEFLKSAIAQLNIDTDNIIGIIDTDKKKYNTFMGKYKIYSPEDLKKLKPESIIVTIVNNTKARLADINDYLRKNNLNIPVSDLRKCK